MAPTLIEWSVNEPSGAHRAHARDAMLLTHNSACVNFLRIFIGLVCHKRPYPFWSFENSSPNVK